MHILSLFLLSWATLLSALGDDPAEDQFGEEVQWQTFSQKPFVMVIADKEAADNAKLIGTALHKTFNGSYTAPEDHLHSSPAQENIKIIPVAALPDVPGIFKWLFRRGFKKESKVGVILDWDSRIAKMCGYKEGKIIVAIKSPSAKDLKTWEVQTAEEAITLIQQQSTNR